MGLDMYAHTMAVKPSTETDFEIEGEKEEIFYWRKHPDLHGWMENLYRKKGGKEEVFNLVTLHLTTEDLDQLESDVKNAFLPPTTGFFFGTSDDDDMATDLEFIKKAREAIADGLFIYYTSWW